MADEEKKQEQLAGHIRLVHADIVVLANAHNPSILSPEWLSARCGVEEQPKQFVHTADFSLFDSESIQITVDQARMQVTSKKMEETALEKAASVTSKYVQWLPHVPYAVVGLNYIWLWEGPEEDRPQVTITIAGHAVPPEIRNYRIASGGIVYGSAPDHRMRTLIEIPGSGRMTFNVNSHFDVQNRPSDNVAKVIGSFKDHMHTCEKVVMHLLLGGGTE